jgi:ParB family chromosome partitioning protein
VTNFVRLLELPDEVKALVEEGRLSAGQARAVLQAQGDANRTRIARLAVERELSVRDVERIARLGAAGATRAGRKRSVDPFVADLEDRLRRALSARVSVTPRGKGGTISVEYSDAAQLDALLEKLGAA